MKHLSMDIESYSETELKTSGVYRYAEDPVFEILLFSYSVDGSEVQTVSLATGESIPEEIFDAITDDSVMKWAHNSSFERVCLSRYLRDRGVSLDPFADNHESAAVLGKAQYLNPASWRCSMVWAAYLGLPLSLEQAGAALGLDKQKLIEGKDLIRYFCKPCNPTIKNGQRTRNLPHHDLEKWEAFKSYNKRDVETEMGIQTRLAKFPVPDFVWEQYCQDQEINDRGVALDMELVKNAIECEGQTKAALKNELYALTHLSNPNSVAQMKDWLAKNGLEMDTLGKKAVAEALTDAPPELVRVLELRQKIAKSSVRKYQAMRNAVCADGRAHGMFQFYGANRTGRWAGRLIQLQNLPQNHLDDLDAARQFVKMGDFGGLKLNYKDSLQALSELVRTAFVPKSGCKFIVADFSAIEARVIAWLAGEKWRNDVFATHGKIYEASANQMLR
jgi:DNA polymerase